MPRLTHTAAAALIAAAIAPASAQADNWYARADAGYGLDGGVETPSEISIAPPFGGEHALEQGWLAAIGAGRAYDSGLRVEAELSYRQNDVEGAGAAAPSSEAAATAALVTLAYDFNRGAPLRPYIGASLGVAQIDAAIFNNASIPADLAGFDDSATAAAYQLQAGLALDLSDALTLDLGYRYFTAPDLEFSGRAPLGAPRDFEADYDHQALTAGLRWRFGD